MPAQTEYKLVIVTNREEAELLERRLNDAAADAWVLHTVLQRGDALVAVMHRPKINEPLVAMGPER